MYLQILVHNTPIFVLNYMIGKIHVLCYKSPMSVYQALVVFYEHALVLTVESKLSLNIPLRFVLSSDQCIVLNQ